MIYFIYRFRSRFSWSDPLAGLLFPTARRPVTVHAELTPPLTHLTRVQASVYVLDSAANENWDNNGGTFYQLSAWPKRKRRDALGLYR